MRRRAVKKAIDRDGGKRYAPRVCTGSRARRRGHKAFLRLVPSLRDHKDSCGTFNRFRSRVAVFEAAVKRLTEGRHVWADDKLVRCGEQQ